MAKLLHFVCIKTKEPQSDNLHHLTRRGARFVTLMGRSVNVPTALIPTPNFRLSDTGSGGGWGIDDEEDDVETVIGEVAEVEVPISSDFSDVELSPSSNALSSLRSSGKGDTPAFSSLPNLETPRCRQELMISSRLFVSSQLSTYLQARFRGVFPVGMSSWAP
jgi:hypothetical protein